MKYEAPDNLGERCVMIEVDAALMPILRGLLEGLLVEHKWRTYADYLSGYQAVARVLQSMACKSSVTIAVDRLYRLLDSALNGTQYSGATEQDIVPALPLYPSVPAGVNTGLRRQLIDAQGYVEGGIFGLGARPATGADIVKALRAGDGDELSTMLDRIDLLGDASDITSIYGAVKGTAVDLAEIAEGGGTLATLVVATLAQAAAAGLAAGQMDTLLQKQEALISRIDRLIASLDGGTEPRPATNVLEQLSAVRVMVE